MNTIDRHGWPSIPITEWQDTRETLHLYTQVVGKVRLANEPLVNHWWNIPMYVHDLGEFVLPYERVRTANDPRALLLEFLQSTYEAAATTAGWDRAALERT